MGKIPGGSVPGATNRVATHRVGTFAGLIALGSGLLLLSSPDLQQARAGERCRGAETTLALLECLDRRLQESDRTLATTLDGVAAAARREAADPAFLERWQRFGTILPQGPDPGRQLRAFQRERRQICRYINAAALQGSGFGVFVLSCELDLSEALLRQLRN